MELPHSLEMEESLIASVLFDGGIFGDLDISAADFYSPKFRKLWEVFGELSHKQEPIDLVTVMEALKSSALKISSSELASILNECPVATSPDHYAKKVKGKATLRSLMSTLNDVFSECVAPGADPEEVLNTAQSKILLTDTAVPEEQTMLELADSMMDRYVKLYENDSLITGVPSGYAEIDSVTSGFQNSDLIIVAGRPSMGKTAWATNIAMNACNAELPVGFLSLEMSKEALFNRMVALKSKTDLSFFRNGKFPDMRPINRACSEMSELPFHIDDKPGEHYNNISRRARRLTKKYDLKLLIIDYLQLMNGDSLGDPTADTTSISQGMQRLTRELGIPVIVLCQLNRKCEERADKRPIMSDLRQSGAIEQDADLIFFLYRDEVYNAETDVPGTAEIRLAKQRNGQVGIFPLDWEGSYCEFS